MRSFMRFVTEIKVFPGFLIQLAVLLLFLPLQWVFAALIAGFLHELSHIVVLRLFRIPIHSVSIKNTGTYLQTGCMGAKQEALCALAGPVGGLLVLLFHSWAPRIAFCCALHSVYNLLPLYPSDGGRALLIGLRTIFSDRVTRYLYLLIKWGTVLLLIFAGVIFAVPALGLLPIMVGVFLVFHAITSDCRILDKFSGGDKIISE